MLVLDSTNNVVKVSNKKHDNVSHCNTKTKEIRFKKKKEPDFSSIIHNCIFNEQKKKIKSVSAVEFETTT